jgi:hypothetical protein
MLTVMMKQREAARSVGEQSQQPDVHVSHQLQVCNQLQIVQRNVRSKGGRVCVQQVQDRCAGS